MITYHYGSFIYSYRCGQEKLNKRYGKGVLVVNVEQSSKWAFKISNTVVGGKCVERTAWIVPVPFCRMCHSNDTGYLSKYKTQDIVRRSRPRLNNVSFVQMMSLVNRSKLKLCCIIAFNTLRNTHRSEEHFPIYCSDYKFSNVGSRSRS